LKYNFFLGAILILTSCGETSPNQKIDTDETFVIVEHEKLPDLDLSIDEDMRHIDITHAVDKDNVSASEPDNNPDENELVDISSTTPIDKDIVEVPDTPSSSTDDFDKDGILDSVEKGTSETPKDTDGDGIPDFKDTDSDDDGISDKIEGVSDFDNDKIPNYLDTDSDGDTIPDKEETNNGTFLDTDIDGIANHFDLDSDGDKLSDKKENELGTDPRKEDTDGDTIDDGTEYAIKSNPLVQDKEKYWDKNFYVILPYKGKHKKDELTFKTDIKKADVLFFIESTTNKMVFDSLQSDDGGIESVIRELKYEVDDIAFGMATYMAYNYPKGYSSTKVNKNILFHVDQSITISRLKMRKAIKNIETLPFASPVGYEALYQALTGEGFIGKFNIKSLNGAPPSTYNINLSPSDCFSEYGDIGGVCFRKESFPIILMISETPFDYGSERFNWLAGKPHNRSEVTLKIKKLGAKFIGIDMRFDFPDEEQYCQYTPCEDFKFIAKETNSLDSNGNPFMYKMAGGDLFVDQIIEAVKSLVQNVRMNVSSAPISIPHSDHPEIDSNKFVKSITPSKIAGTLVHCSSSENAPCKGNTFKNIDPGEGVSFEIDFYNDFFKPTTTESTIFKAKIEVQGEKSPVDEREVFIVVPGIDYIEEEE